MYSRVRPAAGPMAAALLIAGLLTACSSDDEPGGSPPPTAGPSATVTGPSARPGQVLKPGGTYRWTTNSSYGPPAEVTAQVLSYRQPVADPQTPLAAEAGQKGDVWAALEIRICTLSGHLSATSAGWQLAFPDGVRAEPEYHSIAATPRFPVETRLSGPGDCVRGFVSFVAPAGVRPKEAVLAPPGTSEGVAKWPLTPR
ncbi:hypothetical protein [Streptomyces sp. NPDC089919]|uniref:hypothetical protein n=1 Tax=Streptomyces sp. NPDC089919 TaxID=3155188 RepID=UPI00342F7EA6